MKPKGKPRKRPLTPKQLAFIHWYCSAACQMNGTESARRAGYTGNDNTLGSIAAENLLKPAVRAAIDKKLEKALSGAEITIESVLRRVQVIGDKALESEQYASAAKCAELHGKYLKMWTERIEHVQTIEDVSTEELVRLLREIMEAGGLDLIRLIAGDGAIDGLLPAAAGNSTAH